MRLLDRKRNFAGGAQRCTVIGLVGSALARGIRAFGPRSRSRDLLCGGRSGWPSKAAMAAPRKGMPWAGNWWLYHRNHWNHRQNQQFPQNQLKYQSTAP
jgi:hypothetical protein